MSSEPVVTERDDFDRMLHLLDEAQTLLYDIVLATGKTGQKRPIAVVAGLGEYAFLTAAYVDKCKKWLELYPPNEKIFVGDWSDPDFTDSCKKEE